jgi:quercetin dioxygenase-like cupin family protein
MNETEDMSERHGASAERIPGDPMRRHVDAIPAEPVLNARATLRQVLIGSDEAPNFALRRFVMQPGGGMPRHTNTVEHEQYVLRGRARIGIGEDTLEVGAGDVLYIPAGTPHWYLATGDEPFEFLCVVPNRPDEIRVLGDPPPAVAPAR